MYINIKAYTPIAIEIATTTMIEPSTVEVFTTETKYYTRKKLKIKKVALRVAPIFICKYINLTANLSRASLLSE